MKIGTRLTLSLGAIFVVASIATIFWVNYFMRRQALFEAREKERIIINYSLAVHTYFNKELKPHLFSWTASSRPPDYFDPTWMSSTYAIRKINRYFKSTDRSNFYYKECAINARSPENEADQHEAAFLRKINANGKLREDSGVRNFDGKPFFVTIIQGEQMEGTCLQCHSSPSRAPRQLLDIYGSERSFNRQVNELVSAISVRLPLDAAYAEANRLSIFLSGFLLLILSAFFASKFWLGKRWLYDPIAKIKNKALQIADSSEHLGETIPLPKGLELKELATAFNTMSVNLKHSQDSLEDRVRQRTLELDQLNGRLEEDIAARKLVEAELLERTKALQEKNEELEQANETITRLSYLDPLTGINNRRSFIESLQKSFSFAQRHNQNLSMIILDLDYFKDINDEFGHNGGDQALVAVANFLRQNTREEDSLARIGGEEFVILLPGLDSQQTAILAERLRLALEKLQADGMQAKIRASFGITNITSQDTPESFFKRADDALYQAKREGRNCVRIN